MMEFNISTTGINVTLEDLGVTLSHPETLDLLPEVGQSDILDSQDLETALRAGTLVAVDETGREIPSIAIPEWYERISNSDDAITGAVDVSTGATDAGKLTKLDAGGQFDASMVNEASDEFTIKGPTSTTDIRFRTSGSLGGFTIDRPNSASGFLSWFPNATTVQFLAGDITAPNGSNTFYLDADNQGEVFINVLPGAGRFGDVTITHTANLLPGADLLSNFGSASQRWGEIHGQDGYLESLLVKKTTGIAYASIDSDDNNSVLVFRAGTPENLWAIGVTESVDQFVIASTNGVGVSQEFLIDSTTVDVRTKRIIDVVDPVLAQDAATKAYVDANSGSSKWDDSGVNDIKYTAGSVGIGVDPDAQFQLHMRDDTGKDFCVEQVHDSHSAFIVLRKSDGTIGSETAVLTGDKIGGIGGEGFDGAGFQLSAEMAIYASEDFSATGSGSELYFKVVENGTTTTVDKFAIFDDGTKNFYDGKGINVADPEDAQDIATKNYVDQTHTMTVNADGTILGQRGAYPMSVNKTGTGQYDISFDTALPDANYAIMVSNQESLVNRDDIKAFYDSRANTGFFIWIGEQDNGGTGGVYTDREFSVQIIKY